MDEIGSLSVNVFVNGFVTDGVTDIFSDAAADLFGRPTELDFFMNVGSDFRIFETSSFSGELPETTGMDVISERDVNDQFILF